MKELLLKCIEFGRGQMLEKIPIYEIDSDTENFLKHIEEKQINQLEQDLLYAIDAAEEYIDGVAVVNHFAAAKNCLLVTKKHCVGFKDYAMRDGVIFTKKGWNKKTDDELFEDYLKKIKNENKH